MEILKESRIGSHKRTEWKKDSKDREMLIKVKACDRKILKRKRTLGYSMPLMKQIKER